MPRLPLGSDDELVVTVVWEGPEEAESTWEPVSCVFDVATAVLRRELKALRLKMNQKRGLVQRYVSIILWFGGGPEFRTAGFRFDRNVEFRVFC